MKEIHIHGLVRPGSSELYKGTKQNISLHLKNIFADGELQEDRVVKDYLTTAADGKKYLEGEK